RSSPTGIDGSPPTVSAFSPREIRSSRWRPTATPRQSKPGPRLATVAGTRTSTPIVTPYPEPGSEITGSEANGLGDLVDMGTDLPWRRRSSDCPVGVLQPVAREDAHGDPAPRQLPGGMELEQARYRGSRGELAEQALLPGDEAVGVEDVLVPHRRDRTARLACGVGRPIPGRRVSDADGGGDRPGVLDG